MKNSYEVSDPLTQHSDEAFVLGEWGCVKGRAFESETWAFSRRLLLLRVLQEHLLLIGVIERSEHVQLAACLGQLQQL
jgi:hypothetical protein